MAPMTGVLGASCPCPPKGHACPKFNLTPILVDAWTNGCPPRKLRAQFRHRHERLPEAHRNPFGSCGDPKQNFAEFPDDPCRPRTSRGRPRRQISAGFGSRLPDRRPGVGAAADAPAAARLAGRAQHRRLRLGLPRIAAGWRRPVAVEGGEVPRARAHPLSPGPERGPRSDVDLGIAAGQHVPGREVRRRLRDVVRQGSGRGSLRRRVQARQFRRHVEARRRAGPGRRRPRREVVDAAAPVGSPVLGGDDAGAVPVERPGNPRSRAPRVGDEPLLRPLGRLQVRVRHRRELRLGRRRPGPDKHRRSE